MNAVNIMAMRKLLWFVFLVCCGNAAIAQHFDEFFVDKTLRIHYIHNGDARNEEFSVDSYHAGGKWNGTRKYLVDPFPYGNVRFDLYDSLTGQLIFTRYYSTLFDEYRTTEEAEKKMQSFEECVLLPFPRRTVKYTFTSISRIREMELKYAGYFNPMESGWQKFNKEYKVKNLHIGGKAENCLDILFIPDGYAKSDKKKMVRDMKRFASYITGCSPYKENTDRINIRAVLGYSDESGITDPNRKIFRNTLLNSRYNVLNVDRYLMCLHVWKMNEIADDAPYDAIVVICNSHKYGGGGIYNFYATVNSEHEKSAYVIVHELGHSIGGLGDEYFTSEVSVRDYYPEGAEPPEPNLTTLVHFENKWKEEISDTIPVPTPAIKEYENRIGVYEGGGYVAKGVYRPYQSCTMKDIKYNHFCPVCTKSLIKTFHYYSNQ